MTSQVNNLKDFKHIHVPVEGMTCASCVARVEKSINKLEGVSNVSVNFATETASFEIDTSVTGYQDVVDAVEDAGYKIDLASINKKSISVNYDTNPSDSAFKYEKELKSDFLFSMILSIPILILNMGSMSEGFENFLPLSENGLNKILLILTTLVVFIPGRRFFQIFWKNLKHLTADMNSLIAIGTGSAYIFSVLVTLFPDLFSSDAKTGHVYYDTTVVIITLILMGRWLESKAKLKTGSAIKNLIELQPKTVLVRRNNKESEIMISELQTGDIVIIKPGGKIPADGIIKKGYSAIDESMITGESIPVDKTVGSKVIGGTINRNGTFEFEVTAIGDNSLLGQIIKMVESAQGSKAAIQKLADKVSSVFVPFVILIAILTLAGWLVFGSSEISHAIINFVAVLIIACPCALGLATPTAIITGMGKGAQNGILIKNSESLELAHKIETIIFDKTGTITKGEPTVSRVYSIALDEIELLKLTASLEQRSEHPLAQAIVSYAKQNNIFLSDVQDFESLTGMGLKGKIDGKQLLIGNHTLMMDNKINIDTKIQNFPKNEITVVYVAINNELRGLIAIEDPLKKDAAEAFHILKEMNIRTVMITGDNKQTAEAVAKIVGVDEFEADLLPENKIEVVKKFQNKNQIVAMVGDGINDAPALAQSDVSIAIGTGTDVAIETGDIILISGDLMGVVNAINLSRQTLRTIKQNLFWAFVYNVIGLPLAAFGLLNPVFAALAMSFSSVSVVANSLRLKRIKL